MTASYADSHPGHKRSHNEDCYEANPEIALWLVADGVGGHANGEVASAIVRDTLTSDLHKGGGLVDAINHAHAVILGEIESGPANNMGSTVVALRTEGERYEIAWVGDSRAYLFDDGALKQLTRDHNPVSEMLARGILTEEQAANHPERNVLSQSLGVSSELKVKPDRIRGEFHPGQQFLLCSDGLTDELSDREICTLLAQHESPAEQVAALIAAALEAGGRDNVTVVVVGDKRARQAASTASPETTLDSEPAVSAEVVGQSNDKLAWMVLAGLAALALLWVVLKA